MNKKKIIGLLLSGSMLATMAGVGAGTAVNHNNINKINKVLLTAPTQVQSTGYACVINGNGNLVLTNATRQVISYLSVGEMLKIHSTKGNKTLVTVEETGATGYIDNSNMLSIQNANTDNTTRMNRNGYVINVTNSVNLRVGPGMNQQVIEGLSNNTPLRITGKTGDWYRVSVGGNKGYIFGEYVAESNAKNSIIIPPAVSGTTKSVTQHGNISTIHNSTSSTIAPIEGTNNTPVPTTHVKIVNHDVQPAKSNTVVNHNLQPVNHNDNKGTTPTHSSTNVQPVNHNGNTNVAPVHHEINNGHKQPVVNPNARTKVTPKHHEINNGHSQPVINPNAGTKVTPEHHESKGTNTPANPSKYKPVPSGVNGKKGDAVHGHEVTPSKPSTGNTNVKPGTHNNGGSTNPSTPAHKADTSHNGGMNHFTPMNHDGNKGNDTTPNKPATDNGGTIHKGSTNPSTPAHHKDVMAAPTLVAHNYKLIIGKTFNNSMLDAQANEGATITYEGNVNNMKPGTYPITVIATNSQGGKTEAKVNVDVVDVAPVINAENYTMTQGDSFSNADLHISAHSQAGVNLTQDVKVDGSVNTMKPGTYKLTLTVKDQFGATNERNVEVTVNKAANPVFTVNPEVTTPYGVQVLGTELGVNVLGNTNETHDFTISTSGNVNYNKAGTYEITVTVTNQFGYTSSKQVKIIVQPQKVAPKHHEVTPAKPDVKPTPTKPVVKPVVEQGTVIVETVMPDGSVVQGSMTSRTGNAGTEVSVNGPQLVEGYNLAYTTIDGTKTTDIPSNMSIVGGVTNTVVYHLEKVAPVKEAAPTITASNKTVQQGATWNDSMINATANEGATVTYSGTVNTAQPGNYQVTVTAKNSQGTTSTKVVEVTVEAMGAPVISGHNVTLNVGHKFDTSMIGASATVNGNPVQVSYTGNVNTNEEGTYNVTVTASNGFGKVSKQVYTVTVNDSATLVAHNYTMTAGQSFNLSDLNITATNINGTNISGSAKIISGNVNTNEAGTYNITIQVNDGHGATATQTVTVTVKAKPEAAPIISAKNVSMVQGSTYHTSLFDATTNEKDVKLTYSGYVNVSAPGTYYVTITATNKDGIASKKVVSLTITEPVVTIQAQDVTITQGQEFNNSMLHATYTETGITDDTTTLHYQGTVNVNKVGVYNIVIYSETMEGGLEVQSASKTVQVTVKAKPLAPAQVSAQNVTLTQGQTLNDSAFNASSNEAGTTFSYDTSNVNTNTPGTYNVTITATNTQGKVSSITVQVIVKAKQVVNEFTPTGSNGAGTFTGDVVYGSVNSQNQLVNIAKHMDNVQAYVYNSTAYQQELSRLIFNDINQFRKANGLQAFTWSSDLAYMANWKSQDCTNHGYFTHKDLQGQYTNQVFSNQIHFGSWCENLAGGEVPSTTSASGYNIVTITGMKGMAEATFQAWKASPGHRANMLSSNKFGAVAVDGGVVTMEAGSPTEGAFNPITGTFTKSQFPDSLQNPGPNVYTVIMPNKNK